MQTTRRTGHQPPHLPPTHYVDNRIYTDPGLFEEEIRRIFFRRWVFVCHDSELPLPGDFRTTSIAGRPIVVVRGADGAVRAFHNICRHRGAQVVRAESGNAKLFQCFYHFWSYDLEGRLAGVTKPEGYRVPLDQDELGLLPLSADRVAGLVFVCLEEPDVSLREFLGDTVTLFEQALGSVPLEVFQFYRVPFRINWKLWQENNSETYHAYLHGLLMRTASHLKRATPMRVRCYPHGHGSLSSDGVGTEDLHGYSGMGGWSLPGMVDNELRIINLFPDMMINIRSNVVRLDRMIPLEPGRTMLEFRGLAVKGDSPEAREVRLKHHNLYWGPAGRNLLEDMLACESQWANIESDVVRYSIMARDEGGRPTDDTRLRNFYGEWKRLMERSANEPFGEGATT